MYTRQITTGATRLVPLALLACGLAGCTNQTPVAKLDDPEVAAYVELVLPARIEIQRYLTKPVSYAGDGGADGLEVILAAYDGTGDLTKVVGSFHFELVQKHVKDSIGTRLDFWPVDIKSEKAMRTYQDRLSHYYQFPLELKPEQKPLPPGQYILSVWLQLPTGRRLFDEYEFNYDGKGAAPVRPQ
jgi:hypothetical protein